MTIIYCLVTEIGEITMLACVINCECVKSFFIVMIVIQPMLHMSLWAFFVPFGLAENHSYYPL
ncbi:hypothetical protein DJ87_5712 [Bacillus cereus]|nr:hypothetical protein DJ87_5712 [Bacillus cereus]